MDFFQNASMLYNKATQGSIDFSDMDMIINWPLDKLSVLFSAADQTRAYFHDNKVTPCTLINIKSGGCSEDCAFCAQSSHNNTTVEIKDLIDNAEIKARYALAADRNVPLCVVSSGRKLSREEIMSLAQTLSICNGEKHASLGILDKEEFGALRNAGVVCYNHNLETCRAFFPSIVKTHTWEERVETVKAAKEAGLHVCCGGIFGLGETWEHRKEFCLELKALDVDTIPLNFFNPIEGTRINKPQESPLEFLKIVSLFRLTMPKKIIKVCGGREYHLGPLQSLLFYAGANGYISGGYLTTPGTEIDMDNLMITKLGMERAPLRK